MVFRAGEGAHEAGVKALMPLVQAARTRRRRRHRNRRRKTSRRCTKKLQITAIGKRRREVSEGKEMSEKRGF